METKLPALSVVKDVLELDVTMVVTQPVQNLELLEKLVCTCRDQVGWQALELEVGRDGLAHL